ncbi:acyltransferase family protein [Mucilaginibacter agri]|uniref:Acyltransferase family protein n=1 Tax=Mucilaginibacter agri TaxID=2695265 RepID=A0A965ZH73_9SPHI|nr:acyltransferase [Mucilaginibacter agri]NCD70950.1 acyltransferase family protein [Mucilaginibacter agri]
MEIKQKVNSLGFLRGLAVTMVCFCHFGNALSHGNVLAKMFDIFHVYGKIGVQVFFVISGFIIPLSMDKAKYHIKFYFKFLAKRAVRLHPPYLVALVLTFVIIAVVNHVKHIPFPETPISVIKSCFYLYVPANNPVFWTLQIEAEYYIFMGLYFALLKRYTNLTLCLSIPLFMILSQTGVVSHIGLLNYLIFFLMGTVGYLIYNRNRAKNYLKYIFLAALIVFSFAYYELAATIAALFTITFILFYRKPVNKVFDFAGEISYSIYLIHFPIGVKLINLAVSHVNPNYYLILFLVTNVIVFGLGILFWKFVEKPFGNLSNKIRYGATQTVPKPLPLITA